MSAINVLRSVVAGAGVGVALVTALPIFGAVGTITAAGTAFGSSSGAAVAFLDSISSSR